MTVSSSGSTTTTTTDSGSGISFSGLSSGLDTSSIITQLMTIEKMPQDALKTKVTQKQQTIAQYQALNSLFAGVKTNAQALNIGVNWKVNKATSNDSSVTASATAAALPGSLSFSVKNLATAQTLTSFASVSSTSAVVASGSAMFGQANALGISGMHGNSVTDGAHTIAVTQASTGATKSGTAVADSTTLTGSETLQYSLDGGTTTKSITLTAGTYTQKQLATMITTASGGALNVGVNANKSLSLTTTKEGSAATLNVTGGTGLAALGLTTGAGTAGTNGIVTVDGVANTLTNIDPSSTTPVRVNGSAGTVDLTFSGGLRVGSASVNSVNLGDGKLSTVVSNINNAGLGLSAAAVQVAPGQFKLQLAAGSAGNAGAISGDFNAFAGALGQMQVTQAAQDAKITVGSGVNAYDITSSTNSVTDVLPGVTLNLTSADPTKTVTVSIAGDGSALADKVQALVSSANQAISFITQNSAYDASAKKGGALLGDSTAARLATQVHSALTDGLAGSTLGYPGAVGLTTQSDGTVLFDRDKFLAAYQANPEAVASAFVEGGANGTTTLTKPGIAERLATVAKAATDSVSGSITTTIAGQNSTIADLNKQISDWDVRLTARQAALKQQFDALETAMSNFKAQGNWLTGQIAGLSANS